jgi:hypothetical protein
MNPQLKARGRLMEPDRPGSPVRGKRHSPYYPGVAG